MLACPQEAAWLEQQEALLAMQAALPVHQPIYTSRAAQKTRTPELDDAESQQYSPYPRFSRCATRCILDAVHVFGDTVAQHLAQFEELLMFSMRMVSVDLQIAFPVIGIKAWNFRPRKSVSLQHTCDVSAV